MSAAASTVASTVASTAQLRARRCLSSRAVHGRNALVLHGSIAPRPIVYLTCARSQIPHAIDLSHAYACDGGCRIVLDGIAWGGEFPEMLVDSESSNSDAPINHQALRDATLLYDTTNMLKSLLGHLEPDCQEAPLAPDHVAYDPAISLKPPRPLQPSAGRPSSAGLSLQLVAIFDACSHGTTPPSLQQLLSHPYFAPIEGFEREDVRTSYHRWRQAGGFARTG